MGNQPSAPHGIPTASAARRRRRPGVKRRGSHLMFWILAAVSHGAEVVSLSTVAARPGGGGVRGRSLNPSSSSKIASSKPDGRQIAAPTPWRCTRETTPAPPALLLRRWHILPPLRHRWSGA